MRAIALAAALCVGMTFGGVAAAREWTDPAGRLKFDAPNSWATTQERGQNPGDTFTYVISGTANNECHFIAQPSPNTANASVAAVRRAAQDPARFTTEFWTTTLNGVANVFPGNSAAVNSTAIETDGAWPIQRAEATSPRRPVHAALQLRPGFSLLTLCMTYDGADPVEVYNNVIRSVSHPNDAAFAAAAAAAAAAPAPAPTPAPTN
ncbi:MAG: hypothetical protein M0D54_14820 [Hyphomonadaceae bacterium JAD_PAG50586_4]|nr:MAG: hypothetical protein M0D54_14820 [Hyphomonadaceae bacterium JAD_PAG50586_4]